MCFDYISGKISCHIFQPLFSCIFPCTLKCFEAFWLKLYFQDMYLILSKFFSIELFFNLYSSILQCPNPAKVVVVEAIKDDIEACFLLT
jgi:hypothetical protein